ncbi:MAG: phenol hydroxylase [Comamonadaceae bacterium]|nr:MAG: phenol hydroxylase [Comamonadaceae bacterium]
MKTPTALLPEPTVCDISLKFVRVTHVREDGLVMFEFSIGWPEQMVELVLPQLAFDEFCIANQVKLLSE